MRNEKLGDVILKMTLVCILANIIFVIFAPYDMMGYGLPIMIVCLIMLFIGYMTKYGFSWKNFWEIF